MAPKRAPGGDDKKKKKRRKKKESIAMPKFPPGLPQWAKARREVRRLRATTHLLLPKAPVIRLVHQVISEQHRKGYLLTTPNLSPSTIRFQGGAIEAIQHAMEAFVIDFMESAATVAQHAKRSTVRVEDFDFVRELQIRWKIWPGDQYDKPHLSLPPRPKRK